MKKQYEDSKECSDLKKIGLFPKKKRTVVKRRKLSEILASLDKQELEQASINGERVVDLPPKMNGKEPKIRRGGRNKGVQMHQSPPPLPNGGGQSGQLPPADPLSEFRLQQEYYCTGSFPVVGLHTAMMVIAHNPHCHDALKALINATHFPPVVPPDPTTMIAGATATRNHRFLSTIPVADGALMLPHQHQAPPQMTFMPMPVLPQLRPPQTMAFGFSNFSGKYLQGDPAGSSSNGAFTSGNSGYPPPSGV